MHTYRPLLVLAAAGVVLAVSPAAGQMVEDFDRDEFTAIDEEAVEPEVRPDLPEVQQLIIRRTNEFRDEQGLDPLDENQQLAAAAQYFADFMATTGKYGHHADDQRPSERAAEHDYEYCIVLENIGWIASTAGFESEEAADRFMTGWQESEGHRRNLLDPDIHEIGVAVAEGEGGRYYAVQKFGRPGDAEIEFTITNGTQAEVQYRIIGAEAENTFDLPPNATATHSRCRPPELQLVPPEQPEPEPVQVEAGDRFEIVGDPEDVELRRIDANPSGAS